MKCFKILGLLALFMTRMAIAVEKPFPGRLDYVSISNHTVRDQAEFLKQVNNALPCFTYPWLCLTLVPTQLYALISAQHVMVQVNLYCVISPIQA